MVDNDEDHDRSRRPDAEDQGWLNICRILDDRTIERSGDVVYGLHRAQGDEERGFFCLASKSRSMVAPGLTLKSVASGFPVWASKLVALV
jgi:hypothetical protein